MTWRDVLAAGTCWRVGTHVSHPLLLLLYLLFNLIVLSPNAEGEEKGGQNDIIIFSICQWVGGGRGGVAELSDDSGGVTSLS